MTAPVQQSTPVATGESTPSPRRTLLLGFVSTVLIALTSAARSWPFPSTTAEPWFFSFTPPNAFAKYALLLVFILGVAGVCWAWKRALGHARRHEIRTRSVWGMWALWGLPIIVSVPLFSGDVYVYYTDGEAYIRGFDIYESGVSQMGPDSLIHMVHPLWQDTRTMYGPVFMRLCEAIAWIANGNVLAGVVMLRAVVVACVALLGAAAYRLAKFFGRNPAEALAFALLNPLVLFHFLGGAHNDGMMVGLVAFALAVGIPARSGPVKVLALAICALAAAIKLPAFVGIILLGWIWGGSHVASWRRRFVVGTLTVAGGLAMFEGLTVATGLGWGWIHALDVPGLAHPILSPPNALAMAVGGVFGVPLGTNEVTRTIANGLSVLISVYLVLRLGKAATAQQIMRAGGWSLLALGWLGPSVYAWYLIWGIALLAITGVGRMQRLLVGAVVATSFSILPGSNGVLDLWDDWRRTVLAFVVCGVFAWVILRIFALNGADFKADMLALWSWASRGLRRRSRPEANSLKRNGVGTIAS